MRWLRSFARITYSSKLIGTFSLAAFLQLELFLVYKPKYIYNKLQAAVQGSLYSFLGKPQALLPGFSDIKLELLGFITIIFFKRLGP